MAQAGRPQTSLSLGPMWVRVALNPLWNSVLLSTLRTCRLTWVTPLRQYGLTLCPAALTPPPLSPRLKVLLRLTRHGTTIRVPLSTPRPPAATLLVLNTLTLLRIIPGPMM